MLIYYEHHKRTVLWFAGIINYFQKECEACIRIVLSKRSARLQKKKHHRWGGRLQSWCEVRLSRDTPKLGTAARDWDSVGEPLEYFGLCTAGLLCRDNSAVGCCPQGEVGVERAKETLGLRRLASVALQGYSAFGNHMQMFSHCCTAACSRHCNDILWFGVGGSSWALWHCRDTLRLGTAGIVDLRTFFGWALQGCGHAGIHGSWIVCGRGLRGG